MRPWLRDLLLVVLAGALGAWAWRWMGPTPSEPARGHAANESWKLPGTAAPRLGTVDALWSRHGPWGRPPPPPEPPPPPPPPPAPHPVGILATPGGLKAVFLVPGGGEFPVRRGEKLPGGGRLVSITRFRITWIDRDGKKRQHELLGDPVAPPVPPGF